LEITLKLQSTSNIDVQYKSRYNSLLI
jgi:hypothetical protein